MVNITAETSTKVSQFKQKREADENARLQTKLRGWRKREAANENLS